MDKYLCERCGKELVFRCAYSRIDHKLICVECDDKEQPKELMKKIQELETKLAEKDAEIEDYKKMHWNMQYQHLQEQDELSKLTAIDELEKLLDKTQTLDVMVQSGHYINQKKVNVVFKDVIDQQIKSLKGENENV